MASTGRLQIPQDPRADLYLNPENLQVDFRSASSQPASGKNVLRVVVQFFNEIVEDRFFSPSTKIGGSGYGRQSLSVPMGKNPKKKPLIEYTKDKTMILNVPNGCEGVIQTRDKIVPLSSLSGKNSDQLTTYSLPHETKGVLYLQDVQIYFEEIEKPQHIRPAPLIERFDNKELYRWLAVSLALHILLLFMLFVLPSGDEEKTIEDLPEKYQKILIKPTETKPYEPLIVSTPSLSQGTSTQQDAAKQVKQGSGREGEGKRAGGAEGKRGKSSAKKQVQRPSMDKVKNAGVLSFFTKQKSKSGGFEDLVDGSVQDVSKDIGRRSDRFGLPSETKERQGKGIKGNADGGGAKTASIGRGLSTKGRGGGAKGDGLADFGTGDDKTSVVAKIDADQVSVIGTLTQEEISKVIQNYLGQIQYCYEREIQRQPDLAGKLRVNFTIGLTGRVTQAGIQSTTLNSPPVETCVTGVFRRMPFPSPGGTVVEAVYPLTFNRAG
jgi:hypothetical protein